MTADPNYHPIHGGEQVVYGLSACLLVSHRSDDPGIMLANCCLDRVHRDPSLHPRVDRVSDESLREDVFDCAPVNFAFRRLMFRDVNLSWFGRSAVNTCLIRPFSSVAAGPGFLPLRPRFFPNALHHPLSDAIPKLGLTTRCDPEL